MNRCEVDSILAGAIDMHVHAGPVPGPYRQDAVEIAQQQKEYGMGGVVGEAGVDSGNVLVDNICVATCPGMMIVIQ